MLVPPKSMLPSAVTVIGWVTSNRYPSVKWTLFAALKEYPVMLMPGSSASAVAPQTPQTTTSAKHIGRFLIGSLWLRPLPCTARTRASRIQNHLHRFREYLTDVLINPPQPPPPPPSASHMAHTPGK